MGKKGASEGLISKEQKARMATRVRQALMAKRRILGSKAPKMKWPKGCMEGTFPRPYWLPKGWLFGVKEGTNGYSGKGLQVYITPGPEHKKFYHKHDVDKHMGRVLTEADGEPPSIEEMLPSVLQRVGPVRLTPKAEASFLDHLTPTERTRLPAAREIHFCVISARRTATKEGVIGCLRVQAQLEHAGVKPRWYVDAKSVGRYRRLGLDAVEDGGSLCGARNKALDDAAKMRKVCCQVSDDISRWQYSSAKQLKVKTDEAANAARTRAKKFVVSPVAAARFMLAKMRAHEDRPKLGGVYPNENVGRALFAPDFTTKSFIIGDFFVCERTSRVRFDRRLSLKEDYDFSAAHIQKHGAVLRCNRLWITAKHRINQGGACTVRSSKEEQKNIKILRQKWPRAIRKHTKRADEVILQWPKTKAATEVE